MNRSEQLVPKATPVTSSGPKKIGKYIWVKILWLLKFRIPLWIVVAIFVVLGGFSLYDNATSTNPVNLQPIITDAKKVNITITTCDEQLDEHNINIREEEQSLEKQFEEKENVGQANVRIDRASNSECESSDKEQK